MKVIKFGGSSVRDADWMNRVLDIAAGELDSAPILVSSAMGDTTDLLRDIATRSAGGDLPSAEILIESLRKWHFEAARALLTESRLSAIEERLSELFRDLNTVVNGLALLRECTKRSGDLILSFGERMATLLLASRAEERGIPCQLLDSRDFIKTDEQFSQANPLA